MTNNSLLLKERIAFLENRRVQQIVLLREQAYFTFESLKPMSLLKDTLKNFTSQSDLKDDIFGETTGVTIAFLSKKLNLGTSNNPVKKLAGTLLQVGITALLAKKSTKIMEIGEIFLKHLFNRENVIKVEK
jgi:hypothetical protein